MTTKAKDFKRSAAAALTGAAARQAGTIPPLVMPVKSGAINLLAASAALLIGVGIGASEATPKAGAVVRLALEGDAKGRDHRQDDDYDCGL
jgi:hypothetical protein